MNVLNFIIANWDFILLIVAAVVAVVFAIFKGTSRSSCTCSTRWSQTQRRSSAAASAL